MLNEKDTINCLIVGSIKKTLYKMSEYIAEPKSLGEKKFVLVFLIMQ